MRRRTVIVLVAILVPLAAALVSLLTVRRPHVAADVALAASTAALACTSVAAATGDSLHLAWVPSWGAELILEADPLGSLLATVSAAAGVLVTIFARSYLPHHLESEGRPASEQARYHALILLFLGSMIGVATARDLVLLFVFFDLTTLCSYFLIGFDHEKAQARTAALCALLVTGASAAALLLAAVVLYPHTGTFDLGRLDPRMLPGGARETAAALVVVAALAKSAQVPLHFWLPRAMAAPTPVSAYLHSAAMVAAGVFLLLRLLPLVSGTWAGAALPYVGLASILVGSVLALAAERLKPLLAYSTIAQYGYVLLLLGLGGDEGIAGAALYLLAHAVAKCGLFLVAGAVTQVTGEDRFERLGGLCGRMPVLAAAAAVLAATLAGLPGTAGYFKDEALLKAALHHGPFFTAAATTAAALTLAYTLRFWCGIFAGKPSAGGRLHVASPLWIPIVVLAATAVLGAFAPAALASIAGAAGSAAHRAPVKLHLAYELSPSLALAATAWAGGVLLHVGRPSWIGAARAMQALGRRIGPDAVYERSLAALHHLSDTIHELELRDLRDRIAAIVVPAGLLMLAAAVAEGPRLQLSAGPLRTDHVPLLLLLGALAAAALSAPGRAGHLPLVLALTAAGFLLSAVYALLGAPDLALVAVLVETVMTLLLLTAFLATPAAARERAQGRPPRRSALAGILAGAGAFVFSWTVLSSSGSGGVAERHRAMSERVGAKDAVAAILSDFRGLDTAGETTVMALALLGAATLLRRRSER